MSQIQLISLALRRLKMRKDELDASVYPGRTNISGGVPSKTSPPMLEFIGEVEAIRPYVRAWAVMRMIPVCPSEGEVTWCLK